MIKDFKTLTFSNLGEIVEIKTVSKSRKCLESMLIKACLAFLLVFVSCNKGKNDLFRLGIDKAVSLFIAPADSIIEQSLFKITVDGVVEEVSYLNNRGKQIKGTFIPEMLFTIRNSEYFAAKIRNQHNKTDTYLVRKSDGSVFNMNTHIGASEHERIGGYYNTEFFVKDENNYIYFISQHQLFKLNINDINSLMPIPLTTSSGALFWGFTVSAKGDIFYNIRGVYKLRRSAGGLVNVPYIKLSTNSWAGLDGRIKYIVDRRNYPVYDEKGNISKYFYPLSVYAVDIYESGEASFTVENNLTTTGGWYHGAALMIRFNNRVILFPRVFYGATKFLEVENPSNTLREIVLSYDISTINRGINSDNYYYLSGLNSSQQPYLIKIDPATDVVTELFPAGTYKIFEMDVSNNDYLTFNALRMADGVKILGEISPTGEITVIDAKMNVEVIVLKCVL